MTSLSTVDTSPVRLSYVAALRRVVPLSLVQPFTYAQTGTFDPDMLICLAASNPDGTFYGVLPDEAACGKAEAQVQGYRVSNISFVSSTKELPTNLTYLCTTHTDSQLTAPQRDELFTLAQTHLADGGMLCTSYKAYGNPDDTLRFLISEFAPEMNETQAKEFLTEIRDLGSLYFADHSIAREALETAIKQGTPATFFSACGQGTPSPSDTFETMSNLLPRGFAFVGDADVACNYLEMVAPPSSHAHLQQCSDHLLYEPIKDFALQRLVRHDLWIKLPVYQSMQAPDLFNAFTFGITIPQDQVPSSVKTKTGEISLTSPLYTRLIDVMTTLPMGIGDFLTHPAGAGFDPEEVLTALNILVATGIARPMRGRYCPTGQMDTSKPKWANSFNTYLDSTTIDTDHVAVASTIIGGPLMLSAKDALVLQAVNKVGISSSAIELTPTLITLGTKNPTLAIKIMGTAQPTHDLVKTVISQTLANNVTLWYAYGLLAA
ncbi:MAG: methyltransferase regulatory domain-containing protein [Alphaproteobacteria bacterium]|nr:methyltransferase regulatory domain-containing protein [Alphaproteobacteria bacterium]